FALSLMSKPMLVTLPFVMLLLDFWPLERLGKSMVGTAQTPLRQLVLEKIPFLLLSAGASVMTIFAQTKALLPLEHLPLGDRLANATIAYARYLGKAVWPAHLALPYLHPGSWPTSEIA